MRESTDKQIQRILKRANKQALKSKERSFNPVKISLLKWCETYGNISRFEWIKRLILAKLEQDEELGKHVYFDADFYDLYLDNDGVFMFSDTLGGFFGAEQVKEVWQYLKTQNKEQRLFYDLEQVIKAATENEIKEYFRVWEEAQRSRSNDQEMIKQVLGLLQQEQKQKAKRTARFTLLFKKEMGVK